VAGAKRTDKMTADDLEAVAVHEAGHAVSAWVRRVTILRATIVPTERYAGRVQCAGPPVGEARPSPFWLPKELRRLGSSDVDRINDHIVIAYGGPEAEAELLVKPNAHGADYDHPRAEQLVRMIDVEWFYSEGEVPDGVTAPADLGIRRQQHLNELRAEAERLVRDRGLLVERVANELLERETMSGDDVVDVLREAEARLPPVPFFGHLPRRYPAGRVCAAEGCGTVLSVYNGGMVCAIHEDRRGRREDRPVGSVGNGHGPCLKGSNRTDMGRVHYRPRW